MITYLQRHLPLLLPLNPKPAPMKHPSLYICACMLMILAGCNTAPTQHFNMEASLQAGDQLPENPLLQHVITSSVNTRQHTMSTLYGNDAAWQYARTRNDSRYPQGAVLYQVTWLQKEDTLWFGANIPKEITSVTRITFDNNGVPAGIIYKGKPLHQSSQIPDNAALQPIVDQRMAVSP